MTNSILTEQIDHITAISSRLATADTMRLIEQLALIRDAATLALAEVVDQARAERFTWREIGDHLDMTAQGAQQRFAHLRKTT